MAVTVARAPFQAVCHAAKQTSSVNLSLFSTKIVAPVRSVSVQNSLYAQTHTTPDVINFGLGQPTMSLLPMDLFQRAAQQRFQPNQDPALLQYGAGKGYLGFRESLARFLTEAYEYSVNAESLMVTAGNSQAISHAAMISSQDNRRRAFVEQPTYFLAFDIFRELGLSLGAIPVDEHGLDVNALEVILKSGDVPSFVYTIPFYHNPTGAVLPLERRKRLVELAGQYGFRVISDEPYNLLGLSGKSHSSLASYDTEGNVISLGSFSKILAPGLRLGWAQSNPNTIQALAACGAIRSGGGQNPLTASMVHSILELDELVPHISTLKSTFAKRKRALCDALHEHCSDCSFREPDGGYFVWVKVPPFVTADSLYEEAVQHHGVAFTPGSRCTLRSEPEAHKLAQYMRLSFAFYDDNEIRDGVRRIGRALDAMRQE